MNKLLFAMLVVAVLLAAGAGGYYLQKVTGQQSGAADMADTSAETAPDHKTIIGSERPAFALPDPQGQQQTISQWDGDVLAINFWATWCKPCKEEIPEFVELQQKYRDQDVTFIGVAIDGVSAVNDFVARYDMNYPVLVGGQAAMRAAKAYGNDIGALPYTAFVDRDGRITHVHRGRLPKAEADAILARLTAPAG